VKNSFYYVFIHISVSESMIEFHPKITNLTTTIDSRDLDKFPHKLAELLKHFNVFHSLVGISSVSLYGRHKNSTVAA